MKTEKEFKILDEEWKLRFQSFTHCPDTQLRCKFYMTRSYKFKSIELRMYKHRRYKHQLFLYSIDPLVTLHPNNVKEAKIQILKFLTEC
jgi:hypothetical protein